MRVRNSPVPENLTLANTTAATSIDTDFIRSRLSIPAHMTDALDMFWRVRTYATDDIAYKLDAAYREAVSKDTDTEHAILVDALVAVAKHDGCASAMRYRATKNGWDAAHAAFRLLSAVLDGHSGRRCRMALETLSAVLGGKQLFLSGPEVTLDVLFRLVPDAETHFREKARLVRLMLPTLPVDDDPERILKM